MQNYYIRIEDMPSLVSNKLSIIKYVVLKKIIFSFSVLTVSFGLGLDLDSNLFGLGLDSDSNLFGLGLVLDSTKVDLTTALEAKGLTYGHVLRSLRGQKTLHTHHLSPLQLHCVCVCVCVCV